jgi:hypothetical protein
MSAPVYPQHTTCHTKRWLLVLETSTWFCQAKRMKIV